VSGHRIARVSARVTTAVPERVDGAGRAAFTSADDGNGDGGPAAR
jgi:hypothetical protein